MAQKPDAAGGRPANSPADLREKAAWRCVEVRSEDDLRAVTATLAPLAPFDPLAGHERNPAWLARARRDMDAGLLVFLLEAEGRLLGYAMAVTVRNSPWYVEAGPWLVSELSVDRFNCEAGPFIDPRLPEPDDALVLGWLELLRARCQGRTMVGLNCVPAASPLVGAVQGRALAGAGFRLLPPAPAKLRRIMTLDASFEDYLKSLGRSTRQTLNRRYRKLAEEHEVALEIATAPEHVPSMFEGAVEVSKKTYQWQQKIGLNETDRVRRGMESAARDGRLRWYLLRCDGQPVAFMSGYIAGDRFVWPDLGFDPDWSDKAAGLVLQYLVLKDLIENRPDIRRYDCGTLDTENKRRLVKTTEEEHHLFLVPTTAFGTALWGATKGIQGGAALAKHALDGWRATRGWLEAARPRADGGPSGSGAPGPGSQGPGASADDDVEVAVVEDVAALPAAARDLLKAEGARRFMNGFHWYRTFAATCLETGQTPRFYVVGARDGLLVMPMTAPLGRPGSRIAKRPLGRKSLMAMTNHQTRQFGPISDAAPAVLERLIHAFARHLKREGCSLVDLNHLDPAIPGCDLLRPALAAAGFAVEAYHDQTVVHDRFEEGGFAAYMAGLSSKQRNNMRRERKKLEEQGALRLAVAGEPGAGLERLIADYQTVQKASWKPDEVHADHVPTLIRAAAEAGCLRLSVLYLDERPVGADLTFVSGGQANGHKVHFDESLRRLHVGDVLIGMHLENLLDRDRIQVIDFGKNATAYKLKWLKQQQRLDGLCAFNPATVEGRLQHLAYRARISGEAQLSALKRRIEGTRLESLVRRARERSAKG